MSSRLIRAILLLYPRSWRQRYGTEIQQFFEDATADPETGRPACCLLAAELLLGALWEHIRGSGWQLRVVASATALTAVAVIATGSHGDSAASQHASAATAGSWMLEGTTKIGPHVVVTSSRRAQQPSRGNVVVRLNPGVGTINSISGPSRVVVDPKDDRVLSVTRSPKG